MLCPQHDALFPSRERGPIQTTEGVVGQSGHVRRDRKPSRLGGLPNCTAAEQKTDDKAIDPFTCARWLFLCVVNQEKNRSLLFSRLSIKAVLLLLSVNCAVCSASN